MNKEEIEESPYCEKCGHCGYIGCCGISNFIDKHIKGKTDCKNEEIVISEIIDICNYETEVFKENKLLQSQLDIANKKLEEINSVVRKIEDSPYLYWDNVQRILLSIIGDESNE